MEKAEAFRDRLGALRRLPASARISLLDELLGACSPDEAGPVVLALLDLAIVPSDERPRTSAPRLIRLVGHVRGRARAGEHLAALAAIIRRWDRVPDDLRHVVMVAGRGRFAAAAAGLAASNDPGDRMSVCELASEVGDLSLAPVLATLFSDREATIASASERALMRLSFIGASVDPQRGQERADEDGRGEDRTDDAVRDALVASVASVMACAARERRRPALMGAMALLDLATLARARAGVEHALGAWMLGADEEARSALRNTLRASDSTLARRRALEWLSTDALGAAALERLARARTPAEHECVLTRSHLLAHPARARRAAMLGRAGRAADPGAAALPAFLPAPQDVPNLSLAARRGLPRYLRASGAGVEARRRVIEPLLADDDPLVRHACTRTAPPGALADLCFDPDARVARSAMLSWSLVGERAGGPAPGRRLALRADAGREKLLARLARSPHAPVRAVARQEIELLAWFDPRVPAARAAARRRLAREPEALVADLRAVLLSGAPEDRVAAVQAVRGLSLHACVERELLGLCDAAADGPRARVAATALAALAELGTDAATQAVTRHVGVADARVRANAVEGVGILLRAAADPSMMRSRLIELKDDPHHRVRANAVRALLVRPGSLVEGRPGGGRVYEPAAVDSLLAMLSDVRAEHRLAGAWVAGRVLPFDGAARLGQRWAEVSVRVHDLSTDDADPRVRVRAAQCAGLLRARLRSEPAAAGVGR